MNSIFKVAVEHLEWQHERELNIVQRTAKINLRLLENPGVAIHNYNREPVATGDMVNTFPLMYQYLSEVEYAKDEAMLTDSEQGSIGVEDDPIPF